jgi:hypothetical protein
MFQAVHLLLTTGPDPSAPLAACAAKLHLQGTVTRADSP